MSAGARQIDETMLREAAQWFLRIHGEEVSTEVFGAWQQWLARSAAHRNAFKQVEDFWEQSRFAVNAPWPSIYELSQDGYEATVSVAQWRGEQSSRLSMLPLRMRSGLKRPAALAAALLILTLATGLLFLRSYFQPPLAADSAIIATSRAEDLEFALSDGSRVTVGAQSRIDVALSGLARNIVIDSGEAFFKVAREQRPFIVRAGTGTITALGTAFNVRHLEGRVVVTVTEGRVKVVSRTEDGAPAGTTELKAGEQMAYGEAPVPVRRVDPDIAIAWRSGRLKYLNEPLKFVIRDVARYTSRQIVADPTVGEMLYTGTVLPNELDDWLASVREALSVDLVQAADDTLLLRER